MQQLSFDDIMQQQVVSAQPGRTAFIDECGSFGFDFSLDGTSRYYILCAVIVKNTELNVLHDAVAEVKKNNGLAGTELKSSGIGNNYKRRNKIIAELLPIEFRVILFVADKQAFVEGSPLTEYKQLFIKFLHQRLYNVLYKAYPKLKIIEDETGGSEFQSSFRKYVDTNRPTYNLLGEYDFDYTDSKDSLLVQLSDFIGGTLNKYYTDTDSPNYMEMLKSKILSLYEFPNKKEPYFASAKDEDRRYDKEIFSLSVQNASAFIGKYEKNDSYERKMQVALLKYLLFQVHYVDAQKYISSSQLLSVLREQSEERVRRDFLYRRVIAQLRDSGVILASCTQGYKIPISVEDITTYLNQTHTVVSPMLHRIEICRNLIKQQTDNNLDVLDDPVFLRYKSYFD